MSFEAPVPGGPDKPPVRISLLSIALVFLGLGAISFGGGMTGWLYREAVTKRGWLSEAEFLSAFAVAQTLPGGNVANLTAYVGNYLRGIPGAVIAIACLLLVPTVGVVLLFVFFSRLSEYPLIGVALEGIAAGAIGLLLYMAWKAALEVRRSAAGLFFMGAAFLAVGILQWNLPLVFLCLAPLSVACAWPRGKRDAE